MRIRHAEPSDHARVAAVIDDWWGGRPMRDMLPRLFFTHFRDTSFVAEEDGELAGLPLRLPLPDAPRAGVLPLRRRRARAPEDAAWQASSTSASSRPPAPPDAPPCTASPSPENTGSIAFHTRIGFEIEAEVEGYDGSGESRVLLAKTL